MVAAVYFGVYLVYSYLVLPKFISSIFSNFESGQTRHRALSLLQSIPSQVNGGVLAVPRTTKVTVDLHRAERQRMWR